MGQKLTTSSEQIFAGSVRIVAKCKQTYDYKDENRDFKAKREKLKAIE